MLGTTSSTRGTGSLLSCRYAPGCCLTWQAQAPIHARVHNAARAHLYLCLLFRPLQIDGKHVWMDHAKSRLDSDGIAQGINVVGGPHPESRFGIPIDVVRRPRAAAFMFPSRSSCCPPATLWPHDEPSPLLLPSVASLVV